MPWSEWIEPALVRSPEQAQASAWTVEGVGRQLYAKQDPWSPSQWEAAAGGALSEALQNLSMAGPVQQFDHSTVEHEVPIQVQANAENFIDDPSLGLDTYAARVQVSGAWMTMHWTEWRTYRQTPPNLPADWAVIPGREGYLDWRRAVEFADGDTESVRWHPEPALALFGSSGGGGTTPPADGSAGEAYFVPNGFAGPGIPDPVAPPAPPGSPFLGSVATVPFDGAAAVNYVGAAPGVDWTVRVTSTHLNSTSLMAGTPWQAGNIAWVERYILRAVAAFIDLQMPPFRYWIDSPLPLRQRQRNDGLGMSATPRWRGGSSRQASNRWKGYL